MSVLAQHGAIAACKGAMAIPVMSASSDAMPKVRSGSNSRRFDAVGSKAAYGATLSLPRVPAKVPSAILCRPLASCNAKRRHVELMTYALAKPPRAN